MQKEAAEAIKLKERQLKEASKKKSPLKEVRKQNKENKHLTPVEELEQSIKKINFRFIKPVTSEVKLSNGESEE